MTLKQEHELQLGWRRGNEALLEIVRARTPRDQWMVGACLAARARARVVIAALEADLFFTEWVPVWLERAEAARRANNHARASYYQCLANAGRDAQMDARQSARGVDLHRTIIWLDNQRPVVKA